MVGSRASHIIFLAKKLTAILSDNYKRGPNKELQKHRALAKNIFVQDSLYLFRFEQ